MPAPSCCCAFSNNVRHLVLLLLVASITMLFANVVLFSMTTASVIYITNPTSAAPRSADKRLTASVGDVVEERVIVVATSTARAGNATQMCVFFVGADARFSAPSVPAERLLLYAAPGLGVLLGSVVFTLLLADLNGRGLIFVTALGVSATATVLTPFFLHSFVVLVAVRVTTGIALAAALPCAGAIITNWGTLREQLFFIGSVFLFVPSAPFVAWPIAWMCFQHEDVSLSYFICAGVTTLLSLVFLLFYREEPYNHPWVNGIELNKISAGKVQELQNNRVRASRKRNLSRSYSSWVIWIALFAFFFVISFFALFLPTLLSSNEVQLDFNLSAYCLLPFIALPAGFLFSGIANRSICCQTSTQLRIWNSFALGGTGITLFAMNMVLLLNANNDDTNSRIIALLISLAPLGFIVAGVLRSIPLVGRFYAQHIISFTNFAVGLALTIVPVLVTFLVRKNETKEWHLIFLACMAVLFIGTIPFALMGSGSSAGWAEHTWDPSQVRSMRTLERIEMERDECGLLEMRVLRTGDESHY